MKSTLYLLICCCIFLTLCHSMAQQEGTVPQPSPVEQGRALPQRNTVPQQDIQQGRALPQRNTVPQQDIQQGRALPQRNTVPQQDIQQGRALPQRNTVPQQDIQQGRALPQRNTVPQQDIQQGRALPQRNTIPQPGIQQGRALPQRNTVPQQDIQQGQQATGQSSMASTWELEIAPLLQPFNYDGEGRRDPFRPYQDIQEEDQQVMTGAIGPILPLGKWDIDEIRLIGTLLDKKEPKAMFLSPDKKTFILGKGERIGRNNGYIGRIREEEVVVVEPIIVQGEPNTVTRIMRLNR